MKTLGKYQTLEELGSGGFATVYRAHDMALDQDVAALERWAVTGLEEGKRVISDHQYSVISGTSGEGAGTGAHVPDSSSGGDISGGGGGPGRGPTDGGGSKRGLWVVLAGVAAMILAIAFLLILSEQDNEKDTASVSLATPIPTLSGSGANGQNAVQPPTDTPIVIPPPILPTNTPTPTFTRTITSTPMATPTPTSTPKALPTSTHRRVPPTPSLPDPQDIPIPILQEPELGHQFYRDEIRSVRFRWSWRTDRSFPVHPQFHLFIQYAENPNAPYPVIDQVLSQSSADIPVDRLPSNGTYQWRVQIVFQSGNRHVEGQWSQPWTFRIDPKPSGAPPTPTPVPPTPTPVPQLTPTPTAEPPTLTPEPPTPGPPTPTPVLPTPTLPRWPPAPKPPTSTPEPQTVVNTEGVVKGILFIAMELAEDGNLETRR